MQEQRITEQTARLAKQKGVNIPDNNFYCENYEGLCSEGDEFLYVHSLKNSVYDCNNEFGEGERFYANTQSLIQKCLREKHNIHVDVICSSLPLYQYVIYHTDKLGRARFKYCKIETQYTYEEVFEKGLQEALNLIP